MLLGNLSCFQHPGSDLIYRMANTHHRIRAIEQVDETKGETKMNPSG